MPPAGGHPSVVGGDELGNGWPCWADLEWDRPFFSLSPERIPGGKPRLTSKGRKR